MISSDPVPRAPERPREGDHADTGGQDQAPVESSRYRTTRVPAI